MRIPMKSILKRMERRVPNHEMDHAEQNIKNGCLHFENGTRPDLPCETVKNYNF